MVILIPAVCLVIAWNFLFRDRSLIYLIESIVLTVYLVLTEVPNYRLREQENMILHKMLLVFPRIKHQYFSCHHVANAVVNAAQGMGPEMEQMAKEAYRLLMESQRKERIREYIESRKINRYWKLFLIQAYEVSEKGDTCFSENIEYIRMELMEEIYYKKRREYAYAGYVFVTVAPFFMMPVFKLWGLEFTSELSLFYAGTGRLLEALVFLVTVVIYNLISVAKEITFFNSVKKESVWNPEYLFQQKAVKKLICEFEGFRGKISTGIRKVLLQAGDPESYGRICFRMFWYGVFSFLAIALFFFYSHANERNSILSRVENIQEIAPVAGAEKRNLLENYILELTLQGGRENFDDEETIKALLRSRIRLGNEFTEMSVVEEIRKRIQQYQNAKGHIWELLVCVVGGIAVGSIPLLKLCFQASVIRKEAEYEVKQFQSLVLMERKNHEISVIGLLEDMESFAMCFKSVLRHCINSYGFNTRKALLRLKRDGMLIHSGFESLADAFLSVDEVGMEAAFGEIEQDRKLLEKMSRLEAEVLQEKKRDNMEILARIPMVLSVGAYFILPFFVYSLQSVSDVFELLEEIQL